LVIFVIYSYELQCLKNSEYHFESPESRDVSCQTEDTKEPTVDDDDDDDDEDDDDDDDDVDDDGMTTSPTTVAATAAGPSSGDDIENWDSESGYKNYCYLYTYLYRRPM
jgi:hypothetical protein